MNDASVSVPTVTHAAIDRAGLADKITIRDLNFFYGDSRALKSISLSLYQNKVTAFIGPSGCGKSTLLRVLNRMYDLYPHQRATGDVMFDGGVGNGGNCDGCVVHDCLPDDTRARALILKASTARVMISAPVHANACQSL